ncbi:MAG: arylsulfatase A-like enzyme [Mariniblastus sp.]|jgi:arylsulfatase A-like enzyme
MPTMLRHLGLTSLFMLIGIAVFVNSTIAQPIFLAPSDSEDAAPAESRPNVIVIMTDEHNFRTLGCYRERMEKRQAYMWGPSVVETPNIDWIAANGAICTSFYATTPVCSPSRGCLISGLYPQATPVVTNNIRLADDVVTFAEILGQQGYATGYAGKWHLDGDGKPQWAPKRKFGFDDNRYMFNRGHWKNLKLDEAKPRVGSTKGNTPSYDVGDADEKTFTTDFLIDRTIEFVETNKSKPFCYMVSIPDPHGPDTVRAPYDTMYDDQVYEKPTTFDLDDRAIPVWGEPAQKTGFGQSKYYGMVKCIDDNMGRLIESLRTNGVLDNTMIVFTADHGDLRGEHHRQNKGVPWEGSARVPFLVYYPKSIKAGTVINQALTSVDFTPTLMTMFEVSTEQKFHGRDFTELLTGKTKTGNAWEDIAFARGTGETAGWLMAVTDRYKLVVSTSDKPWLFDLKRDPDEMINMIDNSAYREIARKLSASLTAYGEKFKDPRAKAPSVVADLSWAIEGKGTYPGRTAKGKKK